MLDKFIANVGEERLDGPEGPRPELLPGHGPRLDRRARGDARRGAADHRRRLPEPDRRDPGRQEQDPQRRPDRLLRDRHDRARQAQVRRLAELRVLDPARGAARRRRRPRGAAGLPDVPDAGPHPGSDRHAEPALDRRRAGARHRRQVHLLPGHPGRRRRRTPSPRPRRSTKRTWRSTATSNDRVADCRRTSRRLPTPADTPAGTRPTAPPARHGSRACGRASRTPGSTPTSASAASTCAT